MTCVDPLAIGSDVPRTGTQYLRRKIARAVVSLMRLNGPGPLATEIDQAIDPVIAIPTRHGSPLYCRGGHGRLVWRAETFYTEEPETIRWLERMGHGDVYWDIGANVGLYAIYAAKFSGCRVFAFEPEAQNYALLIQNMVMNRCDGSMAASPFAIGDETALGALDVRYLTKGGAYNRFETDSAAPRRGYRQLMLSSSIDDLVFEWGLSSPTHIKIDVDGNEPRIISGAIKTLKAKELRSVLIEIDKSDARSRDIFGTMVAAGFKVESDTHARRADVTTSNVEFSRWR